MSPAPRTPVLAVALLLAIALLVPRGALTAQDPGPPTPDPTDVASPGAIIAAAYETISGPAGEGRDWNRFRSLFTPDARLIPSRRIADGDTAYDRLVLTAEDYIQRAGPGLEQTGFFETEIHRIEERFGPVAHVFSTYESRNRADDPEPFARGVNSFQLFFDGVRWWITTIYWFAEDAEHPIPERYLPGQG